MLYKKSIKKITINLNKNFFLYFDFLLISFYYFKYIELKFEIYI